MKEKLRLSPFWSTSQQIHTHTYTHTKHSFWSISMPRLNRFNQTVGFVLFFLFCLFFPHLVFFPFTTFLPLSLLHTHAYIYIRICTYIYIYMRIYFLALIFVWGRVLTGDRKVDLVLLFPLPNNSSENESHQHRIRHSWYFLDVEFCEAPHVFC